MQSKSKQTIRGKLLTDIIGVVNSDRNKTYGDPLFQHEAAAEFFNSYLKAFNWSPENPLRASDVCQLMILLKVSRRLYGDPTHADTYADQAGYAALTHECVVRQNETSK